MSEQVSSGEPKLDLSDVDHRVGKLVGGGQLREPCSKSDIRRWVMAMDYPNPIHWDEHFARESRFGGLVAPQSICVSLDYGHGCQPSCVGYIPGSHLIFGGEEWWFYASHLKPGGLFYFLDNHPTGLLFETREEGPPQLCFDYYHSSEPLVFENQTDYADRSYRSKGPTRAWIWSIEDIFGALEACGLAVSEVREYPFNVYEQFRSMRRDEQGYWRLPEEWPSLPLMLGFKARWK